MNWIDAHCHVGDGLMMKQLPEELLKRMDSAGVKYSVIVPSDSGQAVYNRESNDYILSLAKKYRQRFIPFISVNPWYGSAALDELSRCEAEGAAGLALCPPTQGYKICDDIVLPVVELAVKHEMPIYITTGVPVVAMPLQLTALAEQFQEGNFIEGRFGWPDFWTDSMPSVIRTPNIYADIAYNAPSGIEAVVKALGAQRVIFSSDSPYLSLENEVEKLRMTSLDENELSLVVGGNILRLIGKRYTL